MSQHNVQILNDQNSTCVHKRVSSTVDLALTRGISNSKCQTKEFDLINTCHKGIITTSQNIRPAIIIKNTKPRVLTGMHGKLTSLAQTNISKVLSH